MTRTVTEIKVAELDRLASIHEKDPDLVMPFMKQTFRTYREALKFKNGKRSPYGKAYRTELLVSCIVFRHRIRTPYSGFI